MNAGILVRKRTNFPYLTIKAAGAAKKKKGAWRMGNAGPGCDGLVFHARIEGHDTQWKHEFEGRETGKELWLKGGAVTLPENCLGHIGELAYNRRNIPRL